MSSDLDAVPLFAGIPDAQLGELGQIFQRRAFAADETLFRQGQEADGLFVIGSGSVGVFARLPGGREAELAVLRAGQTVGELALVDGGVRAATVRALEPVSALFFGRADLLARLSRLDPTAFAIKRRLTAIVCGRLRERLDALAASLADATELDGRPPAAPNLAPAPAPDERYLLRLPFFHAFAPLQLPDLLGAAVTVSDPPARSCSGRATAPMSPT
ncbi:MAG TPA: cyclic nucleotide-binding domain-containing protein [Gaiellaceae bacterium]|nr:cyclic nucleotide-binding domain-containing protein [Gaiellaceae bacterium]